MDKFQLFETNHRNLFDTNEKMTATEHNYSSTDISETDLRDIKLDQLFVWDFCCMFENLKQKTVIELSHIKNAQSYDFNDTN